jgi:hypothetical protein
MATSLMSKGEGQEASELKRNPEKKARRWVVEVAHSWFNRFRKLLVRYEKLDRSFLALNHLAASIIAFRKIKSERKHYLRISSAPGGKIRLRGRHEHGDVEPGDRDHVHARFYGERLA